MRDLPLLFALFLLANMLAGFWRLMRGPTAADRLLVALLFGTAGVGLLFLLGHVAEEAALIDIGLVFALLAALTGVAFAQRAWRQEQGEQGEQGDADDDPD